MEGYSRGSRRKHYKVGEDIRTAGPSLARRAEPRRNRALEQIENGWRRRAGATGVLLAVIAMTVAMTG